MILRFPWDKEPWLERAGTHSMEKVPVGEDERLVFALLEAIDFECWKYGDGPTSPSLDEAKAWLRENWPIIKEMSFPPPSFMGLFGGSFSFLTDDGVTV